MRPARVALVLLVALTACRAAPDDDAGGPGRYGDGLGEGSRPPSSAAPNDRETTQPGGRTPDGGGAPSTAGSVPDGGGPTASYFDRGGVGANARRYLQPSPATSLVVEIDYARGRRPTQQAIAHLRAILERETRKDVEVRADDELRGGDDQYTFDEIDALEARHRDTHSQRTNASIWVVYLDGELRGESSTVGVAMSASTAAVFYDHIHDAQTAVVGADQIERAVLTHEIGHLLALVNIGYESEHDHEDPQSRGHSRHRSSVMFSKIEDKGVVALITGGPADDFDRYDRDDLKMLRRA